MLRPSEPTSARAPGPRRANVVAGRVGWFIGSDMVVGIARRGTQRLFVRVRRTRTSHRATTDPPLIADALKSPVTLGHLQYTSY